MPIVNGHSFFYSKIRKIGESIMKFEKLILLVIAISCCLCGCQNVGNGNSQNESENQTEAGILKPDLPDKLTADEDKVVFSNGYPYGYWARNDRGNGGMFNCAFVKENAQVKDGYLSLILDKDENGYRGAEFRTFQRYGYGYYSVSMKPVKESGVITSFFIYNGRPWDEIDIEFLGKDTTKVQFNYFTNGVGGHEYVYDLGFDASLEFHEYGFEWSEGSITWYVDGKAVYRATENIPSHAGNLMVNLWNVTDDKAYWPGKFECTEFPLVAQYEWFGISSVLDTLDK